VKRIITAALCLAVPALIFLNAWQGYRYNDLVDRVAGLEKQQRNLLEGNRDAIAQIAYESSPVRIEEKAAGALGLVQLGQSAVIRLKVVEDAASGVGAATTASSGGSR
jgi:hypothetical protein